MRIGTMATARRRIAPAALAATVVLVACTGTDPADDRTATPAPGAAAPATAPSDPPAFAERRDEREDMVRRTVEERGITDPRVLAAMRRVPRHGFVPSAVSEMAYRDGPVPIVGRQSMSQAYVVAAMTEAAAPTPGSKCLEIGTGSGYQAAVLAELCGSVYSIEYLVDVAEFAAHNLRGLGYGPDRVQLRTANGWNGWPEAAPFDVILVTAAPEEVPQALLAQLAPGGRMVVPVGPRYGVQTLERWTRKAPGDGPDAFDHVELMEVRFVPMLRDGERPRRPGFAPGLRRLEPAAPSR